ncbi:MAG TPA: SDR family NAD(P)-dependent oxidoreductase [Candidatus Limnocylindria bacterium]|nr:SDR family NAD(P)-dependent oxidoreductase [Candidatus Limnocylindria bacterium]
MGPLDDRTALVTGGSRGIGLAAARGLAAAGARVVLVARDAGRVEAAAAALRADGADVVGLARDVSDLDAVIALPEQLGEYGAVDVLVVAAGVMSARTAKTLRTDPEEWRRVMATNLDGTWAAMSAFGPGMVERRWGRIITLSACLGRFSGPGTNGGLAPYRVSKAGVNALTRNLAHEVGLGSRGVLVDAVCPGHCRTDMGGPDAPRSAAEGAETVLWLAGREGRAQDGSLPRTGLLWEDRAVVPW